MHSVNQINGFQEVLATEKLHSRLGDADYMAVMCHEIGTPLAAIIGLSHIITDMECSPEKKLECAEMMRDSSAQLMELMKNMLDSARMEAGMTEIEYIDFDLASVVQEAVNIVASRIEEKGLDLRVHIANKLPPQYVGDPLRIRQILLNLLSNAVKFTEKGHVSLYVNAKLDRDGNEQLCITVADTGIGIREDSLEKIFGKYVQADASISRKHGGTGLGLHISQEFARLMNGDIAVKSWLGMGSHFIVTLPLQKSAALMAMA